MGEGLCYNSDDVKSDHTKDIIQLYHTTPYNAPVRRGNELDWEEKR